MNVLDIFMIHANQTLKQKTKTEKQHHQLSQSTEELKMLNIFCKSNTREKKIKET